MLVGALLAAAAQGQVVNPVYVDDSPVARETLQRINDFEAAGNEGEAVRELQRLLDDQPDRLVPEQGQPNLFVSVRTRVHRKLLSSPKLLERYRAAENARARREVDQGTPERVERSRFLTRPGFEAALRVAQVQLEAAEFEAARNTIQPLLQHPDLGAPECAPLVRDAADLMGVVASYADHPQVWDAADSWAKLAGRAPVDRHPVERPPALRLARSDFVSPSPSLDHADVPARPLWTSRIDPPDVLREQAPPPQAGEDNLANLYVLPSVWGDCVYVNDGTYITARDRFTLQPRWTLRPLGDPDDPVVRRAAGGRLNYRTDDTCSVSIRGRTLIATTGLVQNGTRTDGGKTYALDTATGGVLWSFFVSDLDPSLDGAAVRGPALIDGSTIVLVARKSSQQRRMVALYLVGVSLESGTLRWVRPIGSAGAAFRGIEAHLEHAATLHRGTVYCADRLGVMAAVEAATGRPLWVRRAPVVAQGAMVYGVMPEPARPWQWDSPIVRDGSMLTISPDRQTVLQLDPATGMLLGQRSVQELGSPAYLLDCGSRLAAVCGDSLNFVPFDSPISGPVTTSRTFASPGIRGRVMVSGNRLLVPRTDGVAVINPESPRQDEAVVRIERTGNILPLSNQLIVVDSVNLHSFVTWSVAQKILDERMVASPQDPDPAITFAELAYRSRHPELIVAAIDKAIQAIDRNASSDRGRTGRSRLFEVIREMVETSQAAWAEPGAPRASTPAVRRRDAGAAPADLVDMPTLDPGQLAPLVDRWGRIAESPEERAAQLMALGRLREVQNQPALAAEAYQRILADAVLAAANWKRGKVSVRSEIEAARRTRQLVLEHGSRIYAAFEAQASHELSALGPGASAEDLERLARKYPAATVGASMWMRCAEQHEGAGRTHATIAALREGLSAAESARAAGVQMDPAVVGELGGRLVNRLLTIDQVFAASRLVTRLRASFPDVALADHGAAVDAQSLATGLAQRLAALRRLPRIGSTLKAETQPLAGWVIVQPMSKEQAGRACEHLVLIAPGEARIALWGVGAGAAGAAPGPEASSLHELWSRPYSGAPPRLYRTEPESVWLIWDRPGQGNVIERISALDGQTLWTTEPFRSLFPEDEDLVRRIESARNLAETPMDGAVKLTDTLITLDEQSLAIVERTGRVACFDPATGKLLWRGQSPVQLVHDADVGGGVLVLGGKAAAPAGPGVLGGGEQLDVVTVLDCRTGRLVHKLEQAGGKVRYVRIATGRVPTDAARASLITGTDSEILCIDVESGKTNWTIPGGPAFESREAWIFGDRLFILDENRSLWLASIATGKLGDRQLETFEHLVGTGSIQAVALGTDLKHTAFSTDRGVCLFDESGRLIGVDALEGGEAEEGAMLPPVASTNSFVIVETSPIDGPIEKPLYNLHILDTKSAMLLGTRRLSIEFPPRRMALLDGRILITSGNNTIIYSAPEVDP